MLVQIALPLLRAGEQPKECHHDIAKWCNVKMQMSLQYPYERNVSVPAGEC